MPRSSGLFWVLLVGGACVAVNCLRYPEVGDSFRNEEVHFLPVEEEEEEGPSMADDWETLGPDQFCDKYSLPPLEAPELPTESTPSEQEGLASLFAGLETSMAPPSVSDGGAAPVEPADLPEPSIAETLAPVKDTIYMSGGARWATPIADPERSVDAEFASMESIAETTPPAVLHDVAPIPIEEVETSPVEGSEGESYAAAYPAPIPDAAPDVPQDALNETPAAEETQLADATELHFVEPSAAVATPAPSIAREFPTATEAPTPSDWARTGTLLPPRTYAASTPSLPTQPYLAEPQPTAKWAVESGSDVRVRRLPTVGARADAAVPDPSAGLNGSFPIYPSTDRHRTAYR